MDQNKNLHHQCHQSINLGFHPIVKMVLVTTLIKMTVTVVMVMTMMLVMMLMPMVPMMMMTTTIPAYTSKLYPSMHNFGQYWPIDTHCISDPYMEIYFSLLFPELSHQLIHIVYQIHNFFAFLAMPRWCHVWFQPVVEKVKLSAQAQCLSVLCQQKSRKTLVFEKLRL